MKIGLNTIALLFLIALIINGCQSIKSSFGTFQSNTNREAMLLTVGYHDNPIVSSKRFVSISNSLSHEKMQLNVKSDSINLCKKQQLAFEYPEAKNDSLSKSKKKVILLSLLNKQVAVDRINQHVDLSARPDLEIISEIMLKYKPDFDLLLDSDSVFFTFNSRTKSYDLYVYKNDAESILKIQANDILGYKSRYLCCTDVHGKLEVKNLSKSKCPPSTFKTKTKKSKTVNYERL